MKRASLLVLIVGAVDEPEGARDRDLLARDGEACTELPAIARQPHEEHASLVVGAEGRAELVLEPVAPTAVRVFADGRALAPQRLSGPTTVTADLSGAGWHSFVVRGAPGLRLLEARIR